MVTLPVGQALSCFMCSSFSFMSGFLLRLPVFVGEGPSSLPVMRVSGAELLVESSWSSLGVGGGGTNSSLKLIFPDLERALPGSLMVERSFSSGDGGGSWFIVCIDLVCSPEREPCWIMVGEREEDLSGPTSRLATCEPPSESVCGVCE